MKIKKKKKINERREFIKTVAAVSASTSFLGCVSSRRRGISSAEIETIYDYIVVGTGAGGAPLAARLAKKGHSVLCIEAGFDHRDEEGKDPIKMSTPAYHALSSEDPGWSWNFFVRHNGGQRKNVLGMLNSDLLDSKYEESKGGILYPRASGIGGCTTHNAMITMVPDNKDWSELERLSGDSSWSASNMRSYFRKIENKTYGGNVSLGAHGFRGWLSTSQTSLKFLLRGLVGNPLAGEFIKNPFARIVYANAKAWESLRHSRLRTRGHLFPDFKSLINDVVSGVQKDFLQLDANGFTSGPKAEGLYRITSSITAGGKRSGPKDWLLKTKQETGKIDIVTGHLAAKILFEAVRGEQKRTAIGVECLVNRETNLYQASPNFKRATISEKRVYKAKKEVILAGGAFNTPQLLMLSGIGKKEDLESKGISPLIDLPAVGQNLQDRYEVGVVSELKEEYEDLKSCTFEPAQDPCLDSYLNDPSNSLYGTNGAIIGNLLRSKNSPVDEDPDLFVFAVPGDFRGYVTGYSKQATQKNKLTWAVLKAKTSNTSGSVKLKSNDPRDTPEINFNNFTDNEEDLKSVLEGVDFARRANKETPLAGLIKEESWPATNSPDQTKRFIAKEAWGHHASCTCPMGRDTRSSVVDYNFKVHKTNNLRIVDASVFPKIPGHFIAAPIYMIAEKAAEVIDKEDEGRYR